MALRQIMLRRKIEKKREALAELNTTAESISTRSTELEKAIEEAETDEEIEAVEEEVEGLEKEKKENEISKKALEDEIQELEIELEELDNKEPENNTDPVQPSERSRSMNTYQERGVRNMPGLFRSMPRQERAALVERSEVKDFLNQVRNLRVVSETRAVKGGELTVPEVMLGIIRDNLDTYSKLINKVRKKELTGKGRQNIAGNIPEAIWTEAIGAINELELLFKEVEIDEYMCSGFIPIHNTLLDDSDLNLATEILEALSQAIGLAVDKAILYGTGSKMPLGIATRLAQKQKPSNWLKNGPIWKDLSVTNIIKMDSASLVGTKFFAALLLKLGIAKPNYSTGGTFWAMSRITKMKLLSNALAFNAAGTVVAGMSDKMPIEGGDIIELDFIPDGDIIGGYGSSYLLGEREDITLGESKHVRFLLNQTVFKGGARYDGLPVFGEAFVLININNTNPTTEIAFAPDEANEEDAFLKSLAIGSLDLSPTFSGAVESYTAETSNATNTINIATLVDKATTSIIVDGTPVANGGSATWSTGENVVTITVANGTTTKTYTVVVTKS